MAIYTTSVNQSVKDICLSCYASIDFMKNLLAENVDIFTDGIQTIVEPNTKVYYNELNISNVALQRKLVDIKINTLWIPT